LPYQTKNINSLSGPRIGDMYHVITLRTRTTSTRNGLGHEATGTNTDITLNAAIKYRDIPETDSLGKQTYVQHVIFTIRYRVVSLSQQIVYGGNTYDIVGIDPFVHGRTRFSVIKTKLVQ